MKGNIGTGMTLYRILAWYDGRRLRKRIYFRATKTNYESPKWNTSTFRRYTEFFTVNKIWLSAVIRVCYCETVSILVCVWLLQSNMLNQKIELETVFCYCSAIWDETQRHDGWKEKVVHFGVSIYFGFVHIWIFHK